MDADELRGDLQPAPLASEATPCGESLLGQLLATRRTHAEGDARSLLGVYVGELLALIERGGAPVIRCTSVLGSQAVVARSVVDLGGAHIGQALVLAFEAGDPARPLVLGLLRDSAPWPAGERPSTVHVDLDGQRMVVHAKEQLVLRCGLASITLTKAGKVLIEGRFIQSRSSGLNAIKGGSVALN